MQKGTIYYDTSSKGSRGGKTSSFMRKWCAEITVNGRRLRRRSSDREELERWLEEIYTAMPRSRKKGATTPIVGFPLYSIDLNNRVVYGKNGRQLKAVKTKPVHYRLSAPDGTRHDFNLARIVYAAQNGLNPTIIPSDVVIILGDDGKLTFQNKQDLHNKVLARCRRQHMASCIKRTEVCVKEGKMLLDYYRTGNSSELMTYVLLMHEELVTHLRKQRQLGREHAEDIVLEAIEQYCQRISDRTIYATNVTNYLHFACSRLYFQKFRNREYNDNIKYYSNH